jgi:putative hydrolase of the HAD superfamily
MYEGILFDLDGVIRHFGDSHLQAAEARYGISRELILKATFRSEAFQEALVGRITAEVWHAGARQLLSAMAGREVGAAVDDFVAFPGWVDPEIIELVDHLRRSLRVGILSNGTTRLEQHLELHGLPAHFDTIVNTARIGVAKPAESAYLIATRQLGVVPAHCLFVDDRIENVDGARAAGLTGLHYQGLNALMGELRELGMETDEAAPA